MTVDENKNNDILKTALFDHCAEGKTGTIMISTKNNKSCQIVLREGHIIAAKLSRLKGMAAMSELVKVGINRASFNADLELPFTDEARIESSDKLLDSLGYSSSSNTNQSDESNDAEESEKMASPKRMYRGQIIDD